MPDTPQKRIQQKLVQLYGDSAGQDTHQRLQKILRPMRPGSKATLALSEKDVILIGYGDHIQHDKEAPLHTLHHFLKDHITPAINSVHLLPFFPYSSDDGFSVIDYYAVNDTMGDWSHIQAMSQDFRLMFDAVFNHMSAQSEWFQKYLQQLPPYDDYFIAVPPETDLSNVTRPRAKPLLTAFDTANGTRHVWTTFSEDQVDLNFSNPDVLLEMLRVLLYYVRQGAGLIRLDAIGFLWKEIGTTCIHLPQTHLLIQLMRDVLDVVAPDTVLITETNVPHEENISYFGDGTNEAQMVYQFPLPPLILHTLATGNATALTNWAQSLDPPGERVTFFNFTASHDGIGLRPVTRILSDEEVNYLAERTRAHGGQVSYKNNSDGTKSPYELNITYFDAITDPAITDKFPQTAIARFIVSQAIMLALQGVPGIYLSSLFGAQNWQEGVEQTGRARTINRRKFNAETLVMQLSDSGSLYHQVYQAYRQLLEIRTSDTAFHPLAKQIVHPWSPDVFAVERIADDGSRLLALHNVTDQSVNLVLPDGIWHDLLSQTHYQNQLSLKNYQIAWLKNRPAE
jgi:sucrose phosphorylase